MVKVARLHQAPMTQIAKDFGISDATLCEWIRKADVDDGARPGVTSSQTGVVDPWRVRTAVSQIVKALVRSGSLSAAVMRRAQSPAKSGCRPPDVRPWRSSATARSSRLVVLRCSIASQNTASARWTSTP